MDLDAPLMGQSWPALRLGRTLGIATVVLGGSIVGGVALLHARGPGEPLAGVVLSLFVILVTTLPSLGIAWWLYRESYTTEAVGRVLGWSLLGGIPLAALVVVIATYQQTQGVFIHDLTFVVSTVAGIGFIGGSLTGIHDVERAQRETAYQSVDDQFTTVIEAAPVAVIAVDADGAVRLWNQAASDLFGYTRDEVLGAPCPVRPLGAEAASCCCFSSTASPSEFECERADGSRIAVECRTTEPTSIDGSSCRTIAILSDVSKRNRRRQRLAVLHRVLRHNLRTGVNVIQGHAQLLTDTAADESAVNSADTILEVADNLYTLSEKAGQIDQTLRRSTNAATELDVADLTRNKVDAVREMHPAVAFELDLPDTAWVRADPGLGTAIREALENAVEHNDADHPHVSVSIDAGDEGDLLDLTVTDNGPGIPHSQRHPVEEGHETQTDHVTGLGLWLLSWTVHSNGGTLEFDTDEPRGTTVTMSLPTGEPPETRDSALSEPPSSSRDQHPSVAAMAPSRETQSS